jgi:hypothetical protein
MRGRASGPPDGAWSALKSPPAAASARTTSTAASRRGSQSRMDRERLRHDGAPGNRSTVGRGTGPRQRRASASRHVAPPTEVGRRAGTSGVDRSPRGGVRSDGVARAASTWSVPSGARARTGGASRGGRSSTRARSSAWERAGRAASHASGAPQARRVTSETAGGARGSVRTSGRHLGAPRQQPFGKGGGHGRMARTASVVSSEERPTTASEVRGRRRRPQRTGSGKRARRGPRKRGARSPVEPAHRAGGRTNPGWRLGRTRRLPAGSALASRGGPRRLTSRCPERCAASLPSGRPPEPGGRRDRQTTRS